MDLRFHFSKGRVQIRPDQLRLEENTQGANNGKYSVLFEVDDMPSMPRIEPFLINIMFCDDTGRQQELCEIQNNISINKRQKKNIEKELDDKDKEVGQQNTKYRRVREKERDIIRKLENLNEKNDLTERQRIENKIKEYEQKLNELNAKESDRRFRGQEIASAPEITGVVGKIAHLAYIQDEGLARTVSWLLRDHMNCIVVESAQIAEQLAENNGVNSTLILDLITSDLPDFFTPLHHSRANCQGFQFNGTIGWLRNQLKMNETYNSKQMQKVFTSLLVDTLFTSDLQKAKLYRKTYEQRIRSRCPTIVTKDGYILFENAIIESVPKDENFVWFQSPPNRDLVRTQMIYDSLNQLLTVYNERVQEYDKLTQLEEEFNRLKTENMRRISDLNKTIGDDTQLFANISQTPLEMLDEDSNHSHYDRDSSDDYKRRRSYSSCSPSQSRERKRLRH